jgi:O-antigen ligase
VIGIAVFYYKYIPLVKPFQIFLIPIILTVFFLVWWDIRAGTLFFIFAFPLINNLPYFFGIHEPFPHAPTALVLFLFYFFGFLIRRRSAEEEPSFDLSISRPMMLFSLLIFVSGLITFFRYANFFPFLSPGIYELITNLYGTRSGGAIMSIIFNALNYLTGLAFFMILLKTLQSKLFLRKALTALCCSSFFSLAFALFQHFGHVSIGNNPTSIRYHLINGTFKDALSFGTYISMTVLLFLGVFLAFPGIAAKLLSLLVIVLSLFIIVFTGSKSGVVSLIVALLGFIILWILALSRTRMPHFAFFKKKYMAAFLAFILIVGLSLTLFIFGNSIKAGVGKSTIVTRFQRSQEELSWRMNTLWKPAFQMIKDYPLTGIGLGGFIIEVANNSNAYNNAYKMLYKNQEITPESAENYLLQVGSELGIIGIAIVLWILWEIARQIPKGFKYLHEAERSKIIFIWIGALSGVIAFIINAQAHTYIGSYEIKYTLWLLVGLIFAIPKITQTEPTPQEEKLNQNAAPAVPPSRNLLFSWRFKTMAAAIILIYGAVHLWNSTHSLSLKSRSEQLGIKQEFGLNKNEKTSDGREFRWTKSYGGMTLKIEKPILVLPLHASHPDIQKKPVRIKIYLVKDFFKHKRLLKEMTLTQNNWQDVFLPVPEEVGQEVILLIKVSRTWNPLKTFGTPDPRNLGVAVGKIEFKE